MAATVGTKSVLLFVCLISLFGVRLCQYDFDKCKGNVKNCYCSDLVIDCEGHEFSNIYEIYPYITGLTFRISITGGKLENLPSDLFGPVVNRINGEHLSNLTYLNLSGNGIKQIGEGAFDHLPKLETLDLSENEISMVTCVDNAVTMSLLAIQGLKKLDLHSAFCKDTVTLCELGNIVGNLNMTRLNYLDLSGNGFSRKGRQFDIFVDTAFSLEYLNLSHNAFGHLVYGIGYGNLVEYDFSYNHMDFLTNQETEEIESLPRLKSMKIGGNPIHCDCRMGVAYDWFNSTDIPLDFDNIICKFSDNATNIGKPITSLRLADICEEPRVVICPYGPYGPIAMKKSTVLVIVVASTALILMFVIALVLLIRNRRKRHSGEYAATQAGGKTPAYSRMI